MMRISADQFGSCLCLVVWKRMATRKRLATTQRGAAAKKKKKEEEEDFSVFGTLDASFLEKEEGPICWSSGTVKTKKSPKTKKARSPKKSPKTKPLPKPKKASPPKPTETKRASLSKPKAVNPSVWEIEEQGNTIDIEDKLGELIKGMDSSVFTGNPLRVGVMELVGFLVREPRALPVLAASSSLLSSLKDVFLDQGGSKEENRGDLSFWRVCLLALVFRESFATHSFYSIELLDFVFSLLDYDNSTFSASSVLELSDSQSFSQCSQNDNSEDSGSDDEGFMLSSLTTYSKPKKEEKVEETPSKTQDRTTVLKRRQLMNIIIKECLSQDTDALFPQTFSVVVLLELIAGGCVIRRYLRTMEFIRFLSKEISACFKYLKAYSTKKDPLRTQKAKKEFQMQILRAESTLQLIEELSVWGGMEKQLTECGLSGDIVQLIGAFMVFFESSSPQKKGNALVRSSSDLSKSQTKKAQPIKHSASSFAGLPPSQEVKKWQLLVDEAYMCDCLLGCEKTIVNLTNHNRLSSQAVGEKGFLETVCSILLLSMSEQKKVDAHLMAIAILLNVFESYPEARDIFRSLRVKASPALTFFSRLFLENLPSQLEKDDKQRKTTTTSRIVPAYVLMLLAMACLDHPKNTKDTHKAFQTTQQGLQDLLQNTIDEVTKIFSQEAQEERDTLLANLVNQLTKKLAFNF